jgi:IS4 transposase
MPAKQTAPIKRLCKAFEKREVSSAVDYAVRSFGDSAQVKLIFVRRRTKEGLKTHVFVSDIAFDPKTASELYRCRRRIETNNREIKFRARTTSRSMKLRRIYYSLAALLYNLWIVMRSMLGGLLRSYEFKSILNIQLNAASPPATFEGGLGPPLL